MENYASSEDECYYEEDYEVDDDQDDMDEFEGVENVVSMPCAKNPTTKVITEESLLVAQEEELHGVMEMLSLKEHHARTLLIHYRWDVEKVLAVFVEEGKYRLCAQAGVTLSEHDKVFSLEILTNMLCHVCLEEVSADEVTTMDCGHCFCNNCWTEHFIVKINEGQSRRIRCMAHKCSAICNEAKIRDLVSSRDPSIAKKFDLFLLQSYIEDNKRVKWCPSVPHCGNAIRVKDDDLCEVECVCGMQFCFRCSSEAHSPCSCLMWELWTKKCRDESESINWITAHAKPCPKCHKLVEKNGGCNLVCCLCGQAFCWLCGGATGQEHTWTTIVNHSCGRYKEDNKIKAERAKRDLFRYIHYYDRYRAHIDSLKLESKLKEIVGEKITTLEKRESVLREFGWATNGLYRLFRSRRILSYSYPFAYFMFGGDLFIHEMTEKEIEIKKNLFEDQQQQLEANVERLSMFLEEPFDQYTIDKLKELKMKILTLSSVIDILCGKLYEFIENDLLGSLQYMTHYIAPYHPKGVTKASEFP